MNFKNRIFSILALLMMLALAVPLISIAQSDRDGDGFADSADSCPNRGNEGGLGVDGSGCPYYDADWDGVYDRNDACPSRADEYGYGVGADGCPLTGAPDNNSGGDNDNPPVDEGNNGNSGDDNPPAEDSTPEPTSKPGKSRQLPDADADGMPDRDDACPFRGNEGGRGIDETGCPYYDADWDGIYDRNDSCPWRANEYGYGIGADGCPLTEADGGGVSTPMPEVTETPEITETPDATETPEITETPDATETPGVTETPGATETPEITDFGPPADTCVLLERGDPNNLINWPGSDEPIPVPDTYTKWIGGEGLMPLPYAYLDEDCTQYIGDMSPWSELEDGETLGGFPMPWDIVYAETGDDAADLCAANGSFFAGENPDVENYSEWGGNWYFCINLPT